MWQRDNNPTKEQKTAGSNKGSSIQPENQTLRGVLQMAFKQKYLLSSVIMDWLVKLDNYDTKKKTYNLLYRYY